MFLHVINSSKRLIVRNMNPHLSTTVVMISLIEDTIKRYNITSDFEIKLWLKRPEPIKDTYFLCTTTNDYTRLFPSYIYDSWESVGIFNTSELISSFTSAPPESNRIGWAGTRTSLVRNDFINMFMSSSFVDIIIARFNEKNDTGVNAYISLPDQIKRWKYLIDMDGTSSSKRLPILLSSPRIVFIVDPEFKEWYYEFLKPWVHYVPVKRDFSDLEKNYRKIENDIALQEHIRENQKIFAEKYLTKDAALYKIKQVIDMQILHNSGTENLFNSEINRPTSEQIMTETPMTPHQAIKSTPEQGQMATKWRLVRESWKKADSFLTSIRSRGAIDSIKDVLNIDNTSGKKISDEIYEQRKISCLGNGTDLPPCTSLRYDTEKNPFCGACGCGANKLSILTPSIEDGYSKLHYPYLECPMHKKGFSNYMENNRIFVQIASYRDPELVLTIADMLKKASHPENLTFGICWQYDDSEDINKYDGDPRFRVSKHHYTKSEGLGWARSITNSLYRGEHYTLQIDSHHRFVQGWDDILLEDYFQALMVSLKPIITTYCTPFNPSDPEAKWNQIPSLMSQYEFSADRLLMSMPWFIQDYKTRSKVIKARTISGHFYFTRGAFVDEVPYDPDIYFGGYTEETTLSVRAFTSGYDFFSPYRMVMWHEYSRNYRVKHWDDHGKQSETKKTSGERDIFARKKTKQLFGTENYGIDMGKYGLGTARTLRDYEIFGGFDFQKCRIQDYTLKVKEPPNPSDWESGFIMVEYNLPLSWDVEFFKSQDLSDPKFLTLGVQTSSGEELFRKDFTLEYEPEMVKFEVNSFVAKFKSSATPSRLIMYLF
jgi:hypothetical protein